MIISVVSAKGGVGKTTFVSNLSVLLANKFQQRVLVVDANITTPTLSFHFGLIPEANLLDVLEEKTLLHNALYSYYNVDILPALITRDQPYPDLSLLRFKIEQIKNNYDFIFIDGAAGIGREAIEAIKSSDRVIVITNPEITALMASMKVVRIAKLLNVPILGVVLNKTRRDDELKKQDVERILGLPVIANIPYDNNVNKAINSMQPLVLYKQDSPASLAFTVLASKLVGKEVKLPFKYKIYRVLGYF